MVQRLRSAERWRAADLAIRAAGGAVLALGAAAAWWLHRSVNRAPGHQASVAELAAGLVVVLCWACGWAAIGEGQGLFRLVTVPGRHIGLNPEEFRRK
jgi:hypothetical protein